MALVTKNFTLNVTPGAMPVTVHVSEYDIGRTYAVQLLDENGSAYEIPTGTTATVEGTLNGTVGFTTSATIDGNQISFALTESMTAYAGKAWCKIKLTLNDEPIQTCAFILAVDRAGVEADTVIGAPGFEEQIQNAVDNYLDEHPVGVEVDPTLTISDAAADAKVTGDKIRKLEREYEDASSRIFAESATVNEVDISVVQDRDLLAGTRLITVDVASGEEYTILFNDPDGCFPNAISLYAAKEDGTNTWIGSIAANTPAVRTASFNIKGFSAYYDNPAATGTVTLSVTTTEENPDSIESKVLINTAVLDEIAPKVNAFSQNRVLFESMSVAVSGTGQFVTRDIDVPATEDDYYNVFVGSVDNVSVLRPIRYRFIDVNNAVIAPDKYITAGVVGTLYRPANAVKLRISLYATITGDLVGTAYFNDVAIWKGNPADQNIKSVISDNIYAQRMTLEGYSLLPDNPLMPSFAHKGYALTAPECTGAAMAEAKRRGYTGVENDTQVTSDGEIVMWHDDTLSKLGDSSHGIGDYTLAQLKAMDFGSWKSSKYANERILTFAEWVLLCKNLGLKINVDTKFEWTESQAASLAQTVIDYGMAGNCVWNINFNGGYTRKLIELIPNATLNYIGTATAERCAILQSFMSEYPGISIQLTPELSQLTAADVARAHSYGIKQFFYTAVDLTSINLESYKAYMDDVLAFGADGGVVDIYRIVDVANMQLL